MMQVSSLEKNNNLFVGIMLTILCVLCLSLAIATNTLVVEQSNKWPYYLPIQSHWPEPKFVVSLVFIQMLRLFTIHTYAKHC